jgi:hypothetical protein
MVQPHDDGGVRLSSLVEDWSQNRFEERYVHAEVQCDVCLGVR